uniref:FCP1 homology domain-containing protein n=1 Tax=Hyaloperonospora arabidopsidis (strain Emoy2) TaxID=559515 RepID=M4C3X0_HYAAE
MTSPSPRKQLVELNLIDPLSNIAHQADKNSKQQPVVVGRCRVAFEVFPASRGQRQGIFCDIIAHISVALGIYAQKQPIFGKKRQDHSSLTTEAGATPGRVDDRCKSVLPPVLLKDVGKKCLVLDLDETLVHSSFRRTKYPHIAAPVEIDGAFYLVYMCKRPGVKEFLSEMSKCYEIVVYTASLRKYADPLLDEIDSEGVIRYRLYHEHCVQCKGGYVKDLSTLNRSLSQTIIVDNAPMSYMFHPQNAIGCSSFIDDPNDGELESISRFLTMIHSVDDVRDHLHMWDANY